MRVLVACEESQTVCKAFRERGHEAYSCDIVECSGGHPEWHIHGDCLPVLNGRCEFLTADGQVHRLEGSWDLIIAHPPCTYFSTAGANWLFRGGKLNEERYKQGLEMKELFLSILNADCSKICVENPVVMKIWDLPNYTQEIQPYQFGHPFSKKTRLWLKGLEELKSTDLVEPISKWVSCGNKTNRDLQNNAVCKASSIKRAKTFDGIAAAMADQWGGVVDGLL